MKTSLPRSFTNLATALVLITASISQAATAYLYNGTPPRYPKSSYGFPVVGPDLALAVVRDGSAALAATVEVEFMVSARDWQVSDLEGEEGVAAVAGQDFAPGIQRVEFQPGESSRVIGVPILDNGRRDKTFLFFHARLTSLTEGLSVPDPLVEILTGEAELTTTFDVTQPTRYEEANPLVLVTKGGGRETVAVVGLFQPLADGRTLVRGEFDAVNGVPRPGLARLEADGQLDESFAPTDQLNPNTLRLNWVSGFPLSDGRVLTNVNVGRRGEPEPFYLHLLHADGTPDPTWAGVGLSGANALLKPMGRFDEVPGRLRYTGSLTSVNGIPVEGDGHYEASVFHFFLTNAPRSSLQIWSSVNISHWKSQRSQNVHFRRLGATDKAAIVHFTTRDLTAVAGADYLAQSGTLTFSPRELGKIVTVPIPPDIGEQYHRDFEIVVTGAEGIEALPAPFRGTILGARGVRAPLLERVKRLRDGRVLLGGSGPQDATKLEFSTDLQAWHPLTNLLGGFNGQNAVWLDASATNAPTRFYRAVAR